MTYRDAYGRPLPAPTAPGMRDPVGGWGPNGPPTHTNSMAALDPMAAYGTVGSTHGNNWYREPIFEPRIFFPNDPQVAKQIRWRTVSAIGEAANTEVSRLINIDIPSTVYAFTASARDTTNTTQFNANGRNEFLVRYAHNSGDRLTPGSQIAANVAGDGRFPALIGAAGWVFTRGGSIEVGITPLRADLRIDVTAWMVEIRSPSNYNPPG